MASEASVTHIGRSTTLRGELSGEGDVQIDGSLEGSVQLTGARITVGPEANVRALLSAQHIVVHGRVEGELRVTGLAELRASARVVGDIYAARLSVEDDATLLGHVDLIQAAEKNGAPSAEDVTGGGPDALRSTTTSAGAPSSSAAATVPAVSSQSAASGTGTPGGPSETQPASAESKRS